MYEVKQEKENHGGTEARRRTAPGLTGDSRMDECHELQEELMNYHQYIIRDPQICGGEPVIKGTRVTIRTILASLAEGACIDEILEDFPTLTEEDVRAVIAFAAVSAGEDLPIPSMPSMP
jgi:uncharacterized protein (DUF433 family)